MDTDTELHDGLVGQHRLGRRAFIGGAAGAVAATALWPGHAAAVEPGASYLVPVDPSRLCDTRRPWVGIGFRRLSSNVIRVRCTQSSIVPSNATAIVLTVTGVNLNRGGNWLSAYPAGTEWPGTASSNSETYDQRVANLVTVKLGAGGGDALGSVDLRSMARSDVVVDLVGYYLPTSSPVSAGRFESVSQYRAFDSRPGPQPRAGQVVPIALDSRIPAHAIAVVANVTVASTKGGGYVTTYPFGVTRPNTSTVNYERGDTRGAAAIIKLGRRNGKLGFDAYLFASARLVVDVLGYITGPSAPASADGLFVAITPDRVHDTRRQKRRVWHGQTTSFALPVSFRGKARAIAANLAVTATPADGYFTAHPARQPRAFVSSLNASRADQTVANHIFSQVSTSGVSCFALRGGHVICDVTGYFTGTPLASTIPWPTNPPPPGGPIPWVLQVPRFGLNQWVLDGDANQIVDAGHSWHWEGTGLVGQGASSVIFGHRTDAGGPYRNQHTLRAGDMAYVYTSDGRRYDYRMVAEYITSEWPNQILAACRRVSGDTISLVSCSKTNRLPTSLRHRLVSTFKLTAWHDLR